MPTEKDVLAALSTVMDPELNVSLVQAGMVKAVRVEGGRVSATIELTTPACPLKGKIQADAEAALKAVPGVTGLDLTWGAAGPRPARRVPGCSRGEEHHPRRRRQGWGGQEHRGGEPRRGAGEARGQRGPARRRLLRALDPR